MTTRQLARTVSSLQSLSRCMRVLLGASCILGALAACGSERGEQAQFVTPKVDEGGTSTNTNVDDMDAGSLFGSEAGDDSVHVLTIDPPSAALTIANRTDSVLQEFRATFDGVPSNANWTL